VNEYNLIKMSGALTSLLAQDNVDEAYRRMNPATNRRAYECVSQELQGDTYMDGRTNQKSISISRNGQHFAPKSIVVIQPEPTFLFKKITIEVGGTEIYCFDKFFYELHSDLKTSTNGRIRFAFPTGKGVEKILQLICL
jgi:hypothetical protein